MSDNKELPILLERFFTDWLMKQKKVSPNTIASYKDTFQLLLKYSSKKLKVGVDKLKIRDLNVDLISEFLKNLLQKRNVCERTRNTRLAAIKSFFRYVALQEPCLSALCSRTLAIPESRFARPQIHYITEEELDALLQTQNLETWVGRRDHVMILVAVETGLRLSELTSLKWGNIMLKGSGGNYIQCFGKGRKERSTPILHPTVKVIGRWKLEMDVRESDFVFPNNKGTKMSPDCFQKQLKKYSKLAANRCESLLKRKITPHTLRHTAAMNLLKAGIDITTIGNIMGHESIETTGVYLEENMKMKEEAMKKIKSKKGRFKRFKAEDKLIKFLTNL